MSIKLFGGKQILPIVQNGSKTDIINSTITQSHLWKECKVFKLETNMRLHKSNIDEKSRKQIRKFAQWTLQIGNKI